jgi:hypothetical protein
MCDFAVWSGKLAPGTLRSMMKVVDVPWNKDAVGLGMRIDDQWVIKKDGISAHVAMEFKDWRSHVDLCEYATSGMLHARAATHGTPDNNANNHPFYSKLGSVLVHKGVVDTKKELDTGSECDSAQILAGLDKWGMVDGLNNCPQVMPSSVAYSPSYNPDSLMVCTTNALWGVTTPTATVVATWNMAKKAVQLPRNQWLSVEPTGFRVVKDVVWDKVAKVYTGW